jgi:DNA-binding response OmpR family regulator
MILDARRRMLVVEDEPVLGDALGAWFEACGFEVARAKSLAEARVQLAGAPFHATLLDVRLPDGDGLSLLTTARPNRTVVISATPDEDRYLRLGVVHHLPKPLELRTLEHLVRHIAADANAA